MFFEEHPEKYEKVVSVAETSPFRFSRNSIARGLDAASPEPNGFHGPRITLAAPDMPPMELTMERLSAGQRTRRQRSTANRIFLICEGSGETAVSDRRFGWRRGDTVVVPTWNKYQHIAETDAQLFCLWTSH